MRVTTMIKLSKTSKLGCYSWALQALDTCPGSKDPEGLLVDACKGCYATTGNYRFQNVKAPREHNKEDWKRDSWIADMVEALQNQRYFRWFDSGDMYSIGLAKKIHSVMEQTPWVSHWMPTRMHKFSKFAGIISAMQSLPNVVVRFSSDSIVGETIDGDTTSTITPDGNKVSSHVHVCPAYKQDGKCLTCRACWSKAVQVVAYVAHGAKMGKLIKTKNIA